MRSGLHNFSTAETTRFSRNRMQNSQSRLYKTNYAAPSSSSRNRQSSFVGAVEARSFKSYQKGKL